MGLEAFSNAKAIKATIYRSEKYHEITQKES